MRIQTAISNLSRAITGQVMEAVFAEWRRPESVCRGALVWTFQDIVAGAGWGVIDSLGRPKPVWYALKRALQPLYVGLTDEGCDGLAIHLANETAELLDLDLELICLRDGATPVLSVRQPVVLPPRSARTLSAFEVIGAFFDITYAYRFGPPSHDTTMVRLRRRGEATLLAQAVHFPTSSSSQTKAKIETSLQAHTDGRWRLLLQTDQVVRVAYLRVDGYRSDDDWLCLTPGVTVTP